MKRRLALLALALPAAFLAALLAAGAVGPKDWRGLAEADLAAPPVRVWALLQDVEGIPGRRRDVAAVRAVERDAAGPRRWREDTGLGGYLLLEADQRVPLKRLKVRLVASSMGLTGDWDYVLEERSGGGTHLTLVEASRCDSFFTRGLLTLGGRDGNLKAELASLRAALENPE